MRRPVSNLSVVFSSLGHAYTHLFAVYFYLVVLPLEREWAMPYSELIALWTLGSLLIGVMAIPAGWVADRWSARGMMVVFFIGLGASAILCGLAPSPRVMWWGLCLLGLFAAIYHPVGLSWLVRTSASRGQALGINGIFGSVGVAAAGLVAGTLIDLFDWRTAFIVPGAVSVLTGIAMLGCLHAGLVPEGGRVAAATIPATPRQRRRAFGILVFTMFGGALIYQATQAALPKLLAVRLGDALGPGAFGVGAMVALVYGLAGLSQIAAGRVADRRPLKAVYVATIVAQVPLLWAAAGSAGAILVVAATAMVVANTATLPAENLLLADAAPENRQSLAFGVKFVLGFGVTPLAIRLVAFVTERTGEFVWLFGGLSGVAVAVGVAALLLPGARKEAADR